MSWLVEEILKPNNDIDEQGHSFPAAFQAECLYQASRQIMALKCKHCRPGSSCDDPCTSTYHIPGDIAIDLVEDWCLLHQHATDEEKKLCEWRFKAIKEKVAKEYYK